MRTIDKITLVAPLWILFFLAVANLVNVRGPAATIVFAIGGTAALINVVLLLVSGYQYWRRSNGQRSGDA